MRKTIDVVKVLTMANRRLFLDSPNSTTAEFRKGVASLLEAILHETDNYAGFGYQGTYVEGKTDETRRSYYRKG